MLSLIVIGSIFCWGVATAYSRKGNTGRPLTKANYLWAFVIAAGVSVLTKPEWPLTMAMFFAIPLGAMGLWCVSIARRLNITLGVSGMEQSLKAIMIGLLTGIFCFIITAGIFYFSSHPARWVGSPLSAPVQVTLTKLLLFACAEEFIFRALPFAMVSYHKDPNPWHRVTMVIITALLFAVAHGMSASPIRLLQLCILGSCFAFVYLRYGYVAAVTAHFSSNVMMHFYWVR